MLYKRYILLFNEKQLNLNKFLFFLDDISVRNSDSDEIEQHITPEKRPSIPSKLKE
jgi:hypothetical protein